METRANNLLVGSFVLLILAGTTVFFLWLAKFSSTPYSAAMISISKGR